MRSKVFALLVFVIWSLGFGARRATAVYNPLAVPNNRVGVHILDTPEIEEAAKLVNSSGGDWGYITIPIRSDDRDPVKWTRFFESTRRLHVVPIIRLATYVDTDKWVAPTSYDLVDFANFLSDMPWPTRNRYVILFNEPNHAKEWGGAVDPVAYATLLIQAQSIFKSRSGNYFLLSAGLDMSAPTNHTSLDALQFYRRMTAAQPTWIQAVDGLAVHAYPNPGYTAGPFTTSRYGIQSFLHELKLLNSLKLSRSSTLPLFISETGHTTAADFYTPAFTQVWTQPQIAAITPFLLLAGAGDFTRFSLLTPQHQPTASYLAIRNLPKTAGSPLLDPDLPPPFIPSFAPIIPTRLPFWQAITNQLGPGEPSVTISAIRIPVERAITPQAQSRGLSGRARLDPDQGMLFPLSPPRQAAFWMNGMLFPLDFIWIHNHRVVGVTTRVPPPSQTTNQPQIVTAPSLVDHVLEVNAGFVEKNDIKVGDAVDFSP